MKRLIFVYQLIALLLTGVALAQPPNSDEDMAVFKEKQDVIIRLTDKHRMRLITLNQEIDANTKHMNKVSEILSYPKNVKIYRDTCIKQLVEIRKKNDAAKRTIEEIYFEWFAHHKNLMAIYTRYGELKATDRVDLELKRFLGIHRDLIAEMEKTAKKIQDIYNETDFQLNTKLE